MRFIVGPWCPRSRIVEEERSGCDSSPAVGSLGGPPEGRPEPADGPHDEALRPFLSPTSPLETHLGNTCEYGPSKERPIHKPGEYPRGPAGVKHRRWTDEERAG